MLAVTAGASRNIYIGLPNSNSNSNLILPSEEELRNDFSNFGNMEQINFIHNRDCGFMNFLHIIDAINVVSCFEFDREECLKRLMKDSRLETEQEIEEFYDKYKDFKISFAKDRCGNSPKFSFKKRITEDNFGYPRYQRHSSNASQYRRDSSVGIANDLETFNRETIDEEAAMVFGIVHKDSKSVPEQDSQQFDEMNRSTDLVDVPEEADEGEEDNEKQVGQEDKKEEQNDDNDEQEEEEEEEDLDDDVSIIIGSDETSSTTLNKDAKRKDSMQQSHQKQHQNHHGRQHYRPKPRYQKIYHSINYSEPSFRRNSSNISLNSYIQYNHQITSTNAPSTGAYMQQQPVY